MRPRSSKTLGSRPASAAAWMLALACLLGGCDYFRPAEPERAPPGAIIVADYSHPDSTLEMIARALADKGKTNGGSVYFGAFAESASASTPAYHQFFSREDAAAWQGELPADWTLAQEMPFYNRLINLRGDLYHMVWTEDPPHPDIEGDVEWTISRRYLLTSMTEDSTVTSTVAVGYADLKLVRGPDLNWRIAIWQDRRDPDVDDPDAPTMGRRRLNLAS